MLLIYSGIFFSPGFRQAFRTVISLLRIGVHDVHSSETPATFVTGTTAGTFVNYPNFKQIIVIADPRLTTAGRVCRMVVTFDAGAT